MTATFELKGGKYTISTAKVQVSAEKILFPATAGGLPLSTVLAENESPDFEEILKVDEWQTTPVAVRAQRPQIFPVDLDVALETRSRGASEPHCRHTPHSKSAQNKWHHTENGNSYLSFNQ